MPASYTDHGVECSILKRSLRCCWDEQNVVRLEGEVGSLTGHELFQIHGDLSAFEEPGTTRRILALSAAAVLSKPSAKETHLKSGEAIVLTDGEAAGLLHESRPRIR